MSPTRWALPRALSFPCLVTLLTVPVLGTGALPAAAQFYEPTLHSLDFTNPRVARSPRLLGMGGLSLVIPDRDASIDLWDFARMPVGLATDDSTSTLDLRPATDALSSVRRLPSGFDRQNLAARTAIAQMEAVYRSESGGVFGVIGDLSGLRWDRPYSATVERREGLMHPEALAILGGHFEKFMGGNMRWATHLRFRGEKVEDRYRSIVVNGAGEWIDQAGDELPPPGEFEPTDVRVNTTAYGVSTSLDLGASSVLALGIERENNDIKSTNELQRSSAEYTEKRPYWVGQAAFVTALGRTLELGVNGIGRLSDSEADWRFTASAGVGGIPLTGRGNLSTREERASALQAHARWTPGAITLAGGVFTAAGETIIDPPNANDPTSLNRFIHEAFNRPNADSLSFPDSVVHNETDRRAWGWGGGASTKLGRGTLGAEMHWSRDVRDSKLAGSGPRRIAWDVRTGYEHPFGTLLTGRLGYAYRDVDEDDYTANNEYVGHAFSLGFGFVPAGSSWSVQTGYVIERRNQDFESPADERQTRQNLALHLRWAF
jgi:hypothetical protein